jgi:hypothetical protein
MAIEDKLLRLVLCVALSHRFSVRRDERLLDEDQLTVIINRAIHRADISRALLLALDMRCKAAVEYASIKLQMCEQYDQTLALLWISKVLFNVQIEQKIIDAQQCCEWSPSAKHFLDYFEVEYPAQSSPNSLSTKLVVSV